MWVVFTCSNCGYPLYPSLLISRFCNISTLLVHFVGSCRGKRVLGWKYGKMEVEERGSSGEGEERMGVERGRGRGKREQQQR